MISIRKFVGYAGAAAGLCGVLVLATPATEGLAAAPVSHLSYGPAAAPDAQLTPTTPSAACTAAIQSLKTWAANDRNEDASERSMAKTDADAADQTEDSSERAARQALFSSIRSACAPATAPDRTRFTPSAACTSAIAALKAAWKAGRPAGQAQWQNLFSLMKAVRTACGWTGWDNR